MKNEQIKELVELIESFELTPKNRSELNHFFHKAAKKRISDIRKLHRKKFNKSNDWGLTRNYAYSMSKEKVEILIQMIEQDLSVGKTSFFQKVISYLDSYYHKENFYILMRKYIKTNKKRILKVNPAIIFNFHFLSRLSYKEIEEEIENISLKNYPSHFITSASKSSSHKIIYLFGKKNFSIIRDYINYFLPHHFLMKNHMIAILNYALKDNNKIMIGKIYSEFHRLFTEKNLEKYKINKQ